MKKSIFKKSQQEIFEDLKKEKNLVGTPYYDLSSPQTINVTLLPNPQIAPALFLPIDHSQNIYQAHPTTIRAVKPDIFATDDDMEINQEMIECEGCKKPLDVQFWKFCPYCEHKFNID